MADQKTLELQIKILAQQALAQVNALSGDLKSLATQARAFTGESKEVANSLKRYESEATKAAASMKLFGASSAEVRRQQELAKQAAVNLVEAGFKPESKEVQNLVTQYKQLEGQAKAIDKANGENIRSFGDLKSAVTQTAAAVALIKTVDKIKDVTGFTLAQADAFQNARNEFGILLGDMDAGAGLFNKVKAFNDKTPFSLETTKQAVSVLTSASVPLAQINEKMTQFGDLSKGNSQNFSSYINAFSQAAAKGKVDMQVLNTYLHQGVPILDELAKGFQTDKASIVEMVSQGKVSFEDFTAALDRLTAEGGKYFGGMELGSKSLAAMQEGLKESANALAASFGSMLLPAVSKVLEIFTSIINAVNESPLAKGIIAGAVVALTGYLAAMAVKQAALAVKTWLAYAAQMGFNSSLAVTNPLLIAGIAAATAATIAVVAYAAAQQKTADAISNSALQQVEQTQAINESAEAIARYAQALGNLTDMQLRDEINKLNQAYNDITPGTFRILAPGQLEEEAGKLDALYKELDTRRGDWIEKMFGGTKPGKIQLINEQLAITRQYLNDIGTTPTQRSQLNAIIDNLEKDLEDTKTKAADIGTAWQDKMLEGTAAINREQEHSLKELKDKANKTYGNNYKTQAAYIEELAALNSYYDKKREDELNKSNDNIAKEAKERNEMERKLILEAHDLRLEKYREEWEYRRELARQEASYLQFAIAEAMAQTSDTDIGQAAAGEDTIFSFISSMLGAVLELENIQKTLNFIGTVVEGVMSVIGPLLDGAFADIVSILTEVGETFGQVLAPVIGIVSVALKALAGIIKIVSLPLHLLGAAFEWLYNNVIRPVGNAIIDLINGVIGAINLIPGINIKKIQKLEAIGEMAQEIAEEMERRKEEITKLYERQKDRVRDELSAQISSIRQQYELGLISRTAYEKQAEKYQQAADDKLYDINKEMLKELDKISENTFAALSPQKQEEVAKSYAEKWGEAVPVLGHIAGAVVDVGAAVWGGIKSIGKGIAGLFGFDSGTPFVPFDMPAMIHQGEGIIPKSFNAGISNGDYALVGRNWPSHDGRGSSGRSGATVNVSVTVEGSVIRERGLVEAIYEGISRGIESGELEPLPA
ncbi:MAG: tape measure protein [Treponema sp.]|nr:tape measure protein [Treponema sp.]